MTPNNFPTIVWCIISKNIKSNKITASTKVDGLGKTYVINREEIIRRYNGQLREATEKINV